MNAKMIEQIDWLKRDTEILMSITCFICGAKYESDSSFTATDLTSFAMFGYGNGWRKLTSKKYQTTGTACKQCAERKDQDR